MDDETSNAVFLPSENTSVTNPKKKVGSAKKADKGTASSKKPDKAATSTKKANAGPTKKVDKAAVSTKKADKEAGPPKKTILDLVCEAIEAVGSVKVMCLFAFLSLLCLPVKFDTSVDHSPLNSSKSMSSASVRRNSPHVFGFRSKLDRGKGRKGASVQAIKTYLISRTESTAPNFNTLINKALTKGIVTGTLERPPAQQDVTGAVGSFRLAKAAMSKRTVKPVKRPKIDSEHASDSEAVVKPVKPRKRNLSDTYIEEMKKTTTSTPKPSAKMAAAQKDKKQTKKVPKKNATNKKDTSDSKIVVKETKRKSVKSYSSDTEVDFKKSKTTKTAKEPLKKTASDKAKTAKAGSPSKESKAKVKKLYNSAEGKSEKSGKTKAK